MKTIYIHIGTHKTGSTALQDFLFTNKNELLNQGFLYPNTGFHINAQHQLSWVMKPKVPNWVFREFPNFNAAPEQLFTKLKNEIFSTECKSIIISSENFWVNTLKHNFKEALGNFKIKIIVYLRRQDYLLESIFIQSLKNPNLKITHSAFEHFDKQKYPYNYYPELKEWSSIFGKENVQIRIYEKEKLYKNDLILDFLNSIEVKANSNFIFLQKVSNKRLNSKIIAFLQFLYDFNISINLEDDVNRLLCLNEELEKDKIFSPLTLLSLSERKSILKRFQNSNYKILKEFFSDSSSELFSDKLHPKYTVSITSLEDYEKIAKSIWRDSPKLITMYMNLLKTKLLLKN